uniref:Putative ATPase domain containing protein n=2 Tax=viral metagenome TaxID=1070528 RepID=A0A6M3IPG1_9ZZZZ
MGHEGIWLYNPETNEPYFIYYDELDTEQLASLATPIGGFCYEATHFQQLPLPSIPYYIKNWLPKQGKSLIYAPAKAGKSTLAVQIARCIGIGEPLLGFPTEQGKVLYIQCELGTKVLQDRMRSTHQSYDNVFVGTSFTLKVDRQTGQTQLKRALEAVEPDVLIIDPIYKVISGDENDSSDMRVVCDFVDSIIEAFECSVILFGHPGKELSRGNRGSVIMEDWVDSCVEMKKLPSDDHILRAKITPKLFRHSELPDPFEIYMHNFEFQLTDQPATIEESILQFMRLKGGDTSPKDLLESGLVSNTTLYKLLNQLTDRGDIVKLGRGKYCLPIGGR